MKAMQEFKKIRISGGEPKQSPDLQFEVMPDLPAGEEQGLPKAQEIPKDLIPPEKEPGDHRIIWVTIIALVFFLLVGLSYFAYKRFGSISETSQKHPINLDIPAAKNSIKLDSDADGADDAQEKALGTNPQKADSDADGLADGDEVNIYKSDPLLFDTDRDGFRDGDEVRKGYSPIVVSKDKASSSETLDWADRIAKFGLHEPTKTTLSASSSAGGVETESQNIIYKNSAYKYSLELPALLASRGKDNGQQVGLYVAVSKPDDEDVLSDPISITTAVRIPGQTLDDFITSQYQSFDYKSKQQIMINGITAVQLTGVANENCPQAKTFFPKDGTIIIVTWTCAENEIIGGVYNHVIQSFKFIE